MVEFRSGKVVFFFQIFGQVEKKGVGVVDHRWLETVGEWHANEFESINEIRASQQWRRTELILETKLQPCTNTGRLILKKTLFF